MQCKPEERQIRGVVAKTKPKKKNVWNKNEIHIYGRGKANKLIFLFSIFCGLGICGFEKIGESLRMTSHKPKMMDFGFWETNTTIFTFFLFTVLTISYTFLYTIESVICQPPVTHVELEGRDGDTGRCSGSGEADEVLAADVAGEERGANLEKSSFQMLSIILLQYLTSTTSNITKEVCQDEKN